MRGRHLAPFCVALFIGITVLVSACKKETFMTDGGTLAFSEDTVHFDTVFSSFKTSTHIIKVYNRERQKVKVNISLKNGDASSYDLNVDGKTGKMVRDIEIASEDSAFIFLTMNIDPTNDSIPFIVEDELVATVNTNSYAIPIIGYAQNAYYIKDSVLSSMTLNTDKPYVIMHSALVEEGATVTVPAGARIYMHRDSRLYVLGTLKIMGTVEQPVKIQGDRIDRRIYVGDYLDIPGEWGGIYFFKESHANEIHNAEIKNGGLSTVISGQSVLGAMIQVDKDIINDGTPKLKMTNTIIKNSIQYGLISFGGSIEAENCLIVDCQELAVGLLRGGKYTFDDCTIGTMGRIPFFSRARGSVSMAIQNYYVNGGAAEGDHLDATIRNSIIYGSGETELVCDRIPGYDGNITLNTVLLRLPHIDSLAAFVSKTDVRLNQDPEFVDPSKSDFHIMETSPVRGTGIPAGVLDEDLDGKPRAVPPSLGAYEYTPE